MNAATKHLCHCYRGTDFQQLCCAVAQWIAHRSDLLCRNIQVLDWRQGIHGVCPRVSAMDDCLSSLAYTDTSFRAADLHCEPDSFIDHFGGHYPRSHHDSVCRHFVFQQHYNLTQGHQLIGDAFFCEQLGPNGGANLDCQPHNRRLDILAQCYVCDLNGQLKLCQFHHLVCGQVAYREIGAVV